MSHVLNNDSKFNLDNQESLWSSDSAIHLVALGRKTFNLSMLRLVWGFHVLHEYSNKGLTRHIINIPQVPASPFDQP